MNKFQELFFPENKNRIDRWKSVGLETIRADLIHNDGMVHVGGPPNVRRLARLWVEYMDDKKDRANKKVTFAKIMNHPWAVGVGGSLVVALILYLVSKVL